MNKEEQEELIKKVKREFKLKYLRPLYLNKIINKEGILQICKYKESSTLEREFVSTNGWNERVLANRWRSGDESSVIFSILRDGNDTRDRHEVGLCLIEVIDSNVLTKDEFLKLFKICAQQSKKDEVLYLEIKQTILEVIKKNKENINTWARISHGFADRIGLEIWQGDLQPYCIKHGEISQTATMKKIVEEIIKKL